LTVYRADNRQRFGFEMSIRGHLLRDQLGYELGWTHFVDSDEDGIDGNEFPENKYSARLNWRHGDWESHATVLYVSPYLSYGYTVGDFTTINLSLSKNFSEKLTMAVFGQNITDEQYGTNNKGYPTTANWGVLRDVGATYGIELVYRF
jgi:outer membrane receptor for ferric coprogen and ferric-rhodotorulic acid